MAKKPIPDIPSVEVKNDETEKVLSFIRHSGEGFEFANGFQIIEYNVPKWVIEKHFAVVSKTEPDLPYIMMMTLEKKAREIVGI